MRVIGHRGCMAHFPQNSVAAVRGAAAHVDMVEVDVRRCGSGELVVFHDEELDGLTEGRGAVRDWDLAELAALTIEGSDEPIPTLEAVVEAVPPTVGLNVELKHPGMADDLTPLVGRLRGDVIVSSFAPEALAPFSDGPIPTGLLFDHAFAEHVSRAEGLGCAYVHPHHELVDEAAVALAHDRGLAVNAWTVPSRAVVEALRGAGVDGVIVDSWTIVPEADRA